MTHTHAVEVHSRPLISLWHFGIDVLKHLKLNTSELNPLFLLFPKLGSFFALSVSMTPALSPSRSSDLTLQSDNSLSLLRCFPQEICCTFNSILLSVFWTNTQSKQKPSLGDEATMKYSDYYNRSHWGWSLYFHKQGFRSLETLNWNGTEQDLSSSKFISITSVALPHLVHSW